MTEAQWLACEGPRPMLEALEGKASERKLRLFAVACCRGPRSAGGWPPGDTAERYADGLASRQEMLNAGAEELWHSSTWYRHMAAEEVDAERARIHAATARNAGEAAELAAEWAIRAGYGPCGLLRCIFGNPFRPVSIDPAWLSWNSGTVPRLAEAIYDGRAFDRLPVLADALEDAGCSDPDLLGHLRGPGPHVRGCWGVDLVLGKE